MVVLHHVRTTYELFHLHALPHLAALKTHRLKSRGTVPRLVCFVKHKVHSSAINRIVSYFSFFIAQISTLFLNDNRFSKLTHFQLWDVLFLDYPNNLEFVIKEIYENEMKCTPSFAPASSTVKRGH